MTKRRDKPFPTVVVHDDWWRDWKARMAAMLAAIDGGSTPRPTYILDFSELPGGVVGTSCSRGRVVAFTSPGLSSELAPLLESAGVWAGEGFCCCVDVDRLGTDQYLDAIVLHELAHHVFDRRIWQFTKHDASKRRKSQSTGKAPHAGKVPPMDVTQDDTALPWLAHGWFWLRMLCHVVYRARVRCGWRGFLDACIKTDYGLRPVAHYQTALGDEPQQMIDESLDHVRDSDAPDLFCRFALQDDQTAILLHEAERSARYARRVAAATEGDLA